MIDLTAIYCSVDNFWKAFEEEYSKNKFDHHKTKTGPDSKLSTPEMMTIFILFHQSNFRTFKHFYCDYVSVHLKNEFPNLISYCRFVYLMGQLFVPLDLAIFF